MVNENEIPTGLNPNALSLENAAKLLTRTLGLPVTLLMVQKDLEAGAPRNGDGTINLVQYGDWLLKEMGHHD